MTGGCHFSAGCQEYQRGWRDSARDLLSRVCQKTGQNKKTSPALS